MINKAFEECQDFEQVAIGDPIACSSPIPQKVAKPKVKRIGKRPAFPRIALTGKAGAGKSTIAGLLEKKGYTVVSFATPLKEFYKTFAVKFNFDPNVKDRFFLQTIGKIIAQKSKQADEINSILKMAKQKIERIRGPVVVDDLRFGPEEALLKDLNFVRMRVVGREYDALQMSGGSKTDVSEIDLDKVEFPEISNTSSLEELEKVVETLVYSMSL